MSDTITLTLRVEGETTVEVDRAEYEAAKQAGEVDHFLDHDLSDLDGRNTVIEPDGRSYNPHSEPHGPGDAPVTAPHVPSTSTGGPAVARGATGGGAGG
jgi:hypothetical protein